MWWCPPLSFCGRCVQEEGLEGRRLALFPLQWLLLLQPRSEPLCDISSASAMTCSIHCPHITFPFPSPQSSLTPHTLPSHPSLTPSHHTLPSHPPITPSPTLPSHPPLTPSPHTLPSHPPITPSPHTFPSHPPLTPSPHTLPSHPPLTPSPHTLPSHPPLTPSPHTLPSHLPLTPSPHTLPSHPPRCGRPVRLMLDRHEDMVSTGTRHPVLARYKVHSL